MPKICFFRRIISLQQLGVGHLDFARHYTFYTNLTILYIVLLFYTFYTNLTILYIVLLLMCADGRLRLKTWSKYDFLITQTTGQHICVSLEYHFVFQLYHFIRFVP